MSDYTAEQHAMRWHAGMRVREELGYVMRPMRGFLMEGPRMSDGSWYRIDHRAHTGHWGMD